MSNRTALFSRKQSGGMFSIEDTGITTGARWFVHSGTGTDAAGYGQGPDSPTATIDYAIGLAEASVGDVIYVMPGHAENIGAAGIDVDKIGVKIVGLGIGGNRPTVTLTAEASDVDIDAASVTIENIVFVANFADITAAIDVNADDFTISGCEFRSAGTDLNFLVCIQDAAAVGSNRITVEGCKSLALDAGDTHFVNFAGTGDGHVIQDNLLFGAWATMAIGGAGVVTRCTIIGNTVFNAAVGADLCISMAATATGVMAFNTCTAGHATDGIVCGDLGSVENYYELSTSDLSGVLEPASS